jgi:non-ribosomal peptide synthetase component F
MVGFFLNSLVMRCDLTGEPTCAESIARIRRMCLAAFAHQAVPFDRLVEELTPERDLSRTPLYQVEFDLHDEGWTDTYVAAEDMEALRGAWRVSKTDLCLYLRRRADGSMTGILEYATTLFDQTTAERVARHYVRLLELICADPTVPAHAVDFLAPGERLPTGVHDETAPAAPSDSSSTVDDAAPESPAQQRIVELWAELLGVEADLRTSFFGLGGNSIQAIRLISRMRDEFGVEVPVQSFFQRPTVADLAAEVEALIRAELATLTDAELLAESADVADGGT